MAIEKTVFTSTGSSDLASEIATWLTANASEFFDDIEVITTNGIYVYCGIDGGMAIRISTNATNKSAVKIKNGEIYEPNSYSNTWQYGIKTSKGIAIYNTDDLCIMATKSNENTVSVALKYGSIYVCGDFDNSSKFITFNSPVIVNNTWIKSFKTSLAPIVNTKALTYADGLYLQVFSQYPNVDGIFTINGKQYYTDGVLVLEG